MSRYAVLLRGVNAGGNRRVLKSEFQSVLENLGFYDVTIDAIGYKPEVEALYLKSIKFAYFVNLLISSSIRDSRVVS